MKGVNELKRRVALANRIAYNEGLHEEFGNEFSGHISVRKDSNIIIPGHLHDFGKGLRDIKIDDIITVDLNGRLIDGKHEPVDEVIIHTSIYKARPEIKSVAHLHSPVSVALASTDTAILPLSMRSSFFCERLPILERGPGVINDEEMAAVMIKLLGKSNALIHKGHGVITAGRNLEEACVLALYLEGAAKNQLLSHQLGGSLKPFKRKDAIEYAKSHQLHQRRFIWTYFENKWSHLDL